MQLIPALDLKDGCVVHAIGGNRQSYQPLNNTLFPSSDPLNVVSQLCERLGCQTFYIADLDAITGEGSHMSLVHQIANQFPNLAIWFDYGIKSRDDFEKMQQLHVSVTPIVATETLTDPELLKTLCSMQDHFILSLDFRRNALLGDISILESAENWPDIIIALSLSAVGMNAGPDLKLISALRKKCGERHLVAGGGVRNQHDLDQLKHAGADATLIANALYTGAI